jgi:hypothetical protein
VPHSDDGRHRQRRLTPPTCAFAGCENPVKRHGSAIATRHQVVDGVRWRIFCSTRCAAREPRRVNSAAHMVRLRARALEKRQKAVVERLKQAGEDVARQWGVPAVEVAKFAWHCERRGYYRGYKAAWEERRRKLLGADRRKKAS